MNIKPFLGTILFMVAVSLGAGTTLHMVEDNAGMQAFVSVPPSAPGIVKTNGAPAFGHPMVPGGIHTEEEFNAVRGLYPISDGYVFTTIRKAGFAYVSYMKNGQMYWTKKMRFMPVGLPVITDGTTFILQKCGNMARFDTPLVSETLPDEPSDLYPPTIVVGDNLPVVPVVVLSSASIPFLNTSAVRSSRTPYFAQPAPFLLGPGGSLSSSVFVAPAPIASMDEPSSGELLVAALVMLASALAFEKSRRRFL